MDERPDLHWNGFAGRFALAMPGFYLMQWLIRSQFLRWSYARGGPAE